MRTMQWMFVIAMTAVALTCSAATTPGSAHAGIEGTWQGTLMGAMRLVVHVDRSPTGSLTGTMDSPDQGAMGLALDTLVLAGDSLRFELRRAGGSYAGRMLAAGDSIVGEWRQRGMTLPLGLRHMDKAVALRRPQEPKPPYPYAEDTVRVENRAAGVSLGGTLTTPGGAGPFPCAVLVTGSGPEDRDETIFGHRPFMVIADHLARHGIAALRLDDRGVAASSGRFSRATSEDFASDIMSAVTFLKTRPGIDPQRIGLIGHSEGGLIAPMVATRSKDVAFIVLMAGPGIPGDSTMMLQSAAIRRSIGVSDASIAEEMSVNRRMYAQLRAGDSVGVVRTMRELVGRQVAALPEQQRNAIGDIDSTAAAATRQMFSPWMRFFATYDPRPTLQRVSCPVLAINGGKDLQVLPKENLAAIETALKAGASRHYAVKELPGLNHLFQHCTLCTLGEYMQLEETIAPVALETMSEWILAQATAPR